MARYRSLHPRTLNPREAVELQRALRAQVVLQKPAVAIATVAGADISFNRFDETIYAGIVVLRPPSLARLVSPFQGGELLFLSPQGVAPGYLLTPFQG